LQEQCSHGTRFSGIDQRVAMRVVRLKITQFLAIVLTALALVPGGAHLFELPNKISLDQEHYFIVQSIYRGWALFGFVLFPALAANVVAAAMLRGKGGAFWLAVLAILCIAANLTIFFAWTYPANVATDNWTTIPANWSELRRQWEYSHAANAVLMFAALCSVVLSTLITKTGVRFTA
jgi:hypothetical protein